MLSTRPSHVQSLQSFRLEVFVGGLWRFYGTVKAYDRAHAESIVYERYPVSRFKILNPR